MEDIYNKLFERIDKSQILKNEPMSKHTTFKIGGSADFYIKINNIKELQYVLEVAKKENIQVTIIGNGSNILVKDGRNKRICFKIKFS